MIALATTTPTGSTPSPSPIAGGEPAQTSPVADEQPTFDHILAREAQSDNAAPSPRGSNDGIVAKGRDLREAGPHKDTDPAIVLPADPALLFQLPLTPNSLQPVGGSVAGRRSTDSTGLDGSAVSGASTVAQGPSGSSSGIQEVVKESGASIQEMQEAAGAVKELAVEAPVPALNPLPTVPPAEPIRMDQASQSLDPKVSPTDETTGSVETVGLSNLPRGAKAGADNPDQSPRSAVPAAPLENLGDYLRNAVTAPVTSEAARPAAGQPAPPPITQRVGPPALRSGTVLGQIGLLSPQAPAITTKSGAEAPRWSSFSAPPAAAHSASTPEAPRATGLPTLRTTVGDGNSVTNLPVALAAGRTAGRSAERAAPGALAESALSVRLLNNQPVAAQRAAPTVQSASISQSAPPRSAPDQKESRPRVMGTQVAGQEQDSGTPAANPSAWLLNPMVTHGQAAAPARAARIPIPESADPATESVTSSAATSSASDRVRHAGQIDTTPSREVGTTLNVAGLSVVPSGPSYARLASGLSAHSTGTDAAALYQPIAQRVLMHGASLHVQGASSSFNVVLNPRSLGMVMVHVARGQEGLQVTITPQQNDTTALLNKHLPDLVGMLKQGGQDLPVQAQVVQTHGAAPMHNGTPQAASAGQSGLNMSMNTGDQAFTGGQGNSEQGAWAATANDLFGSPDRITGNSGPAPIVVQTRIGSAARIDIQA